jgi:hypothetical protein
MDNITMVPSEETKIIETKNTNEFIRIIETMLNNRLELVEKQITNIDDLHYIKNNIIKFLNYLIDFDKKKFKKAVIKINNTDKKYDIFYEIIDKVDSDNKSIESNEEKLKSIDKKEDNSDSIEKEESKTESIEKKEDPKPKLTVKTKKPNPKKTNRKSISDEQEINTENEVNKHELEDKIKIDCNLDTKDFVDPLESPKDLDSFEIPKDLDDLESPKEQLFNEKISRSKRQRFKNIDINIEFNKSIPKPVVSEKISAPALYNEKDLTSFIPINKKFCHYGKDCSNKACTFLHKDRGICMNIGFCNCSREHLFYYHPVIDNTKFKLDIIGLNSAIIQMPMAERRYFQPFIVNNPFNVVLYPLNDCEREIERKKKIDKNTTVVKPRIDKNTTVVKPRIDKNTTVVKPRIENKKEEKIIPLDSNRFNILDE